MRWSVDRNMNDAQDFPGDESKDRNFVTALARGLDILRCFRDSDTELTNTDFAERTDLPKATVSRLTHTLVVLGYLVMDQNKQTYRLGAGVLELGFSVLSGMDIAQRAEAEMMALRDGPNSYITVALAEIHGNDAVYVAVKRSREEVALSVRIGSRLPLFFSAIGRAILVGMGEAGRAAALENADRIAPDLATQRRESLKRAMSEYEAHGYCTGYGDWRVDVNGVAVPVFSLNGARVNGLNVGGPSFHVKKKQLEKVYAPRLIAASQRLSIGK